MKSPAEHIAELKRPYLDEFLTLVYRHYDIVVWSQTNWKWLEMKLTEMGMLTNPKFFISFVLDRTFMFPITSTATDGTTFTHEVKPLEIIWAKLPEHFNSKNTIHIDDLGRNFALNPQNGLKIKPFKNAPVARLTDNELVELAQYLLSIAELDDFATLKHDKWKKYMKGK